MWTQFWDMHSGGSTKEKPYEKIYIEAPKEEAKIIFYNRFGHNPERVTCTCCGADYSISEEETLGQLTGFHRGCDYAYFDSKGREVSDGKGFVIGKGIRRGYTAKYVERPSKKYSLGNNFMSLGEYLNKKNVLVIHADEIGDSERRGDVPKQGYVWQE